MFNNFFENLAFCEIMWKDIVEPDRPQMAIWRMQHTLRICDIFPFPLQQSLHESASILHYTYIACLV